MIRLVIINPKSGTGRGEKYLKTVKKIFCNMQSEGLIKDDKVFCEFTKGIGDATVISQRYITRYDEGIVIYVIGGDGTVGEVAKACINKEKVSIVVIPKGTGNDFSKAVNSYKSMRKIIRSSVGIEPTKVDSIIACDKICINVINAGFDAAIADNMDVFRKWPFITGSMKYKLAIFYTLASGKNYKFKIRVDDKVFKGKYTLVAIGNNKYYGGGIKVLPEAEIEDGLLDICLVDSTNLLQKLTFLPKFTKGKHTNIKLVHIMKGKEFSIVSNKKFPVSIDGEVILTNKFKAKITPKSVNVIKTIDK